MLFTKSVKSYEDFKNIFGVQEHGNGVKSRKNKILLSLYKSATIRRRCREIDNYYPLTITSMSELKIWALKNLQAFGTGRYYVKMMDYTFRSDTYETDSLGGVCKDGDGRCYRYLKHENGTQKVYKMKVGKLFTKIVNECSFGALLPEPVKVWLAEEMSADWVAYTHSQLDRYTLHVGSKRSDFATIYGSCSYKGNFHSCMMNEDQHDFYVDAVKAKAAWLTDEDGDMVARCVIYTEVHDTDSDKIWRLAERQYTSDLDESLKRLLVLKLIDNGEIDGYKQIGADCHDARNFVDNDGKSLRDKCFFIDCRLHSGDTLSYQDSFKYYNEGDEIADNYGDGNDDLADTNRTFRGEDDEWDDYHECYVRETVGVNYHGNWISCDADDLDDFRRVNGEWYHIDDVVYDDYNDEYILDCDSVWCEEEGAYCHEDNAVELYGGGFAFDNHVVQLRNGAYAHEDDDDLINIDGDWYIESMDDDEIVEIDGRWYRKDDTDHVFECEECGEYFLVENLVEIDGGFYCPDCAEELTEKAPVAEAETVCA